MKKIIVPLIIFMISGGSLRAQESTSPKKEYYDSFSPFSRFNYVNMVLHDLGQNRIRGGSDKYSSEVKAELQKIVDQLTGCKFFMEEIGTLYEFVGTQIAYDHEKAQRIRSGKLTPYQFPYETLMMGTGVCADQAMLLACFLELAGFDTGLILINDGDLNHAACAVRLPASLQFNYAGRGVKWKFEGYNTDWQSDWLILDPTYGHNIMILPSWIDRYGNKEGEKVLPTDRIVIKLVD